MTDIDPLLIKFTCDERTLTRDIREEYGVTEAKFIRAAIRHIVRKPRIFKAVLKELKVEKKEVMK